MTEFVARESTRRLLDRSRPLWEVYVVDGLAGDRFAVVTKTHQAVIDEVTALDIAGLVLDLEQNRPRGASGSTRPWSPRPAPAQRSSSGRPSEDALSSPANLVHTSGTV